jgi:spore coat polysaccharide biosynthesis predicted glycosyltransferase SpsG
VALAEEFAERGWRVTFLGEVQDVPWARRQITGRGFPLLAGPTTAEDMVATARAGGYDLVVLDSYDLDPACGGALRQAGVPVLAIVDGDLRGQAADVYVDQNLDAELLPVRLPSGARRLAGLPYAMLRQSVRALRPPAPPAAREGPDCAAARGACDPGRIRVLCFFGGTDAFGAAPVLTRLLVATGEPFAATVVAGRPALADELRRARPAPGQSIAVVGPTDDLPALVLGADLVVSAAGTSAWELMCLGAAAAVVSVVDNQKRGYERMVARNLAVGLGKLTNLTGGDATFAVRTLRALLLDHQARGELAARAWAAVDGRGQKRVADVAQTLIDVNPRLGR